jgi:hypothetical protein
MLSLTCSAWTSWRSSRFPRRSSCQRFVGVHQCRASVTSTLHVHLVVHTSQMPRTTVLTVVVGTAAVGRVACGRLIVASELPCGDTCSPVPW